MAHEQQKNNPPPVEAKAEKSGEKVDTGNALDTAKKARADAVDKLKDKINDVNNRIEDHAAQNPDFRGKAKEMLVRLNLISTMADSLGKTSVDNSSIFSKGVEDLKQVLSLSQRIQDVSEDYRSELAKSAMEKASIIAEKFARTKQSWPDFIATLRNQNTGTLSIEDPHGGKSLRLERLEHLVSGKEIGSNFTADQLESVIQLAQKIIEAIPSDKLENARKATNIVYKLLYEKAQEQNTSVTNLIKTLEVPLLIKERYERTVDYYLDNMENMSIADLNKTRDELVSLMKVLPQRPKNNPTLIAKK